MDTKQINWPNVGLGLVIMIIGLYFTFGCGTESPAAPRPEVPRTPAAPADPSPEMTLRTFWGAIQARDEAGALACTSPSRIRQGRHGRDVKKYIEEHGGLDPSQFTYLAGQSRCSIRSRTHCMDYDMEKNDKGEWIIVSIHP